MTLWTVVPEELIFGQESQPDSYEEIEFSGARMLVERISDSQRRIVRIISTDPSDYLCADLQPGVILTATNSYERLS